jgi:hypothetical protein
VVTYALIALGATSLVQLVLTGLLLRRRRETDLSRVEQRLAHFGEALALLTDTAQTGFTSVALQLERAGDRRAPVTSRAAATRRIVGAARKGRSVQDIAANEEVSESEIRLHLGLASDIEEASVVHDARPSRKTSRSRGTLDIGA